MDTRPPTASISAVAFSIFSVYNITSSIAPEDLLIISQFTDTIIIATCTHYRGECIISTLIL